MLRLAAGDPRAALDDARDVLAVVGALGKAHQLVKFAFTYGLEAALLAGDCGAADELLEWSASLRPGELAPSLRAQTARFRARLGDDADEVDDLFVTAIALFREYGIRFWLAVTQLEYAEWLVAHDRADEATAFVDEARARFEELGARPWLERAAALASAAPVQAA